VEQTIKLLEHQSTGEGLHNRLVYSESNNRYRNLEFSQKKLDSINLTIKIETLLMICTLCATSLLTVTSTPDLMDHQIIHGVTSEEHLLKETPSEFTRTLEVQGVPIGFVISPFFCRF
jgi:hypothetical protein